jgi:hypothetical protein
MLVQGHTAYHTKESNVLFRFFEYLAKCTENRLAVAFHHFAFHKDKVLVLRRIRDDALPVAIDTDTEARDDSLR